MLRTVVHRDVKRIYKPRAQWSHKGDFGKLLVIGGSSMYSGSPALAALAAIKSGTDLVTVAAPERAADIAASFSPDMITYPLKGSHFSRKHIREVLALAKGSDAAVIGGGLGRGKETIAAVSAFLTKTSIPVVVDADAIYALKGKGGNPNFVITPHSYEFYVIAGREPSYGINERSELVKTLATRLNSTVLLKGSFDVISDGREISVNRTGNPCMTKGGTGDTLAGICGALLARKANPFDAASAAAFINGAAGDLASREFGESLFATDLINSIHKVIR
jgi:hydroxyethylthiazole kinase-like uncharacterized protein yjeF